MLTAEENERLTRTGPGTAMGDTFRHYWQPALLSRELPHPDCPPVRVRLLGEEFLAFRDSDGRAALVEPRCPHRGADLFFGRSEGCGLRCTYHGWKFNGAGECVDIPNVPEQVAKNLKPRASIRALQVEEAGDIIWAYFGEDAPPLPDFEFMSVPPEQRFVSKKFQQCNWAQACEGGLDTAHFSYLHAGVQDGEKAGLHLVDDHGRRQTPGENEPPGMARFRWLIEDGAPRFSILDHAGGLLLCAARTADDDQLYWRMTQYLLPNHSLAPGSLPESTALGNTWVPVDDESCWIFCYAWHPEREIGEKERARLDAGAGIFAEVDDGFMPIRRRENNYLIDRDLQRDASYTGIAGISEQDQAIADSQGLIADRTREMLVQTDLGVVRFREEILRAADDVAHGRSPKAAREAGAYRVRSGDYIAAQDVAIEEVVEARFGRYWGQPIAAG